MSPWVLASKALGFTVPFVIASLYGISWVTDTFFYTLAIPTFIVVITANSAANVFLSALTEAHQSSLASFARISGGLAWVTALLAIILAVFVGLGAAALLAITPTQSPESITLSLQFGALLLPYVLCIGMNASFKPSCDVLGLFSASPIAGLARTSVLLLTVLFGEGFVGVFALPLSFSLGEMIRAAVLWAVVRRNAGPMYGSMRPTSKIVQILSQTRTLLIAELLIASTMITDKVFSSWLEVGQLSALEYAEKLRLVPQLLIEGTVIPVAFASWAALSSKHRVDLMMNSAQETAARILLLLTPVLSLGIIFRDELVSLVLGHATLMPQHLSQISELFALYLIGVLFLVTGTVAFKIHILQQRWHLIVMASGLAAVINLTLNLVLVQSLGILGIVMASLVAWAGLAILYQWRLHTLYPRPTYWLIPDLLLAFSTTTLVGISALGTATKWQPLAVLTLGTAVAMGITRHRARLAQQ